MAAMASLHNASALAPARFPCARREPQLVVRARDAQLSLLEVAVKCRSPLPGLIGRSAHNAMPLVRRALRDGDGLRRQPCAEAPLDAVHRRWVVS